MSDFLLELRSEEIPARMQAGARANLARLFTAETATRGLPASGAVSVWSTPRRLVLLATSLPLATATVADEIKGPRTNAPAQAMEGFLRKTGLTREQLTQRDGIWFACREKPGRSTAEVLAEAIPALIRSFAWPKSMRWGAASRSTESLRWVRPLSGIVALLGDEIVDCEVGGIRSGRTTLGHRFHSPGEISIETPTGYLQQLRAHYVIVDQAVRETIIRDGATAAAAAAGLVLVEDEGLVAENAGLTEWPVPLLGRFDEAFLEVPPEVIQLTARTNQKYFICRDPAGRLADAFICTANIVATDGGAAIVAGNGKVLAARLSDARFFWEQDRRKTLAQHAEGLSRITFHEQLGSVADKVERVAKLARWLIEEGIVAPLPLAGGAGGGHSDPAESPASTADACPNPSRKREGLARLAEQAARLCKADLVTKMVGEFPELQGVMGGYYARKDLPEEVADAIRDHYKPVGQGDEVPTAPVTVAVSLADKLDTLVGFFSIDERPTGSKDPFALRRAALAVAALIVTNSLRCWLQDVIAFASSAFDTQGVEMDEDGQLFILDFIIHRLKVQQRDIGVRHDIIDAIYRAAPNGVIWYYNQPGDLVSLLARVHALQSFITTDDGINLLAGYKRAANILKKEGFALPAVTPAEAGVHRASGYDGEMDSGLRRNDDGSGVSSPLPFRGGAGGGASPDQTVGDGAGPHPNPFPEGEGLGKYPPEPAEAALIAALDTAAPRAEAAIAAEDFAGAMVALAALRDPIDAFFDQVIVNDADANKRAARLRLLDQFRAAVHKVADFSLIEG